MTDKRSTAKYPAGTAASVPGTRDSSAFAGVTDVMKAAGVTWSNEGLGNDLLTDELNYK